MPLKFPEQLGPKDARQRVSRSSSVRLDAGRGSERELDLGSRLHVYLSHFV